MAGAGNAILFIVSLVGLTIWSLIFFTFTSHYFLTTLTESSSGNDEVQYPSESFIEWWWKPIFCLWVLSFWVIPVTVLLSPLAVVNPQAFVVVLVAIVWLMYPVSLISALYTQNWFFFVHPVILWRMIRHIGAFTYVHLLTLLSASICAALLFAAFTQTFLWAIPAAIMIPTSLLFYARHWGRFAWLSLNFVPRKGKANRAVQADAKAKAATETWPEMDVQEVEEGIRPGAPNDLKHGLQKGSSATPESVAPVAPKTPHYMMEEEWSTDTDPYLVADDPTQPTFHENAKTPAAPVAAQTTSAPLEEEEDEWSTEKKPYGVVGDGDFQARPTDADDGRSEADKPMSVAKHYDDQADREKAKKKKAREDSTVFGMPPPTRNAPTFADALFFGVWRFMIYHRTLGVWANLVVLTMVELFFLFLVRSFVPAM